MIVNPGIRRFLGSAIQRLFNSASFYAPLTHTLALERGTGSPTFTRASTATVTNNDGYLVTALAGEARFVGARRVRNLITGSSEVFSGWTGAATVTYGVSDPDGGMTASTLTGSAANTERYLSLGASPVGGKILSSWWIRRRTGTGSIRFYNGSSSVTDITSTLTTEWQQFSSTTPTSGGTIYVGVFISTSGDAVDVWHPQTEDVTAQTTQTAGEYVSVGVESAPYYHGSMVDGVKCFPTDLSGNPIPAATMLGYVAEGARTNHFLQSGTPATQTSGSLSTGTYTLWMDGTGSIAVAGATATITGAGTATSSTAVTFVVTVAGTVTYTVTGSPTRAQSENGAQRSSYIPTTTIAVARNADVLTYSSAGNASTSALWLYAELKPAYQPADLIAVTVDDGSNNNRVTITESASGGQFSPFIASGGVTQYAPLSAGAMSTSSSNKVVVTMSALGAGAATNAELLTTTGAITPPASFTTIRLSGRATGDFHWFGTIRNVRIGQRQLSASELGAITS